MCLLLQCKAHGTAIEVGDGQRPTNYDKAAATPRRPSRRAEADAHRLDRRRPRALRIGLVDEVLPAAQLLARGEALAQAMIAVAPQSLTACFEAVQRGASLDLDAAFDLEATLFGQLCATRDKAEGTAAFLEKRPPHWTGR